MGCIPLLLSRMKSWPRANKIKNSVIFVATCFRKTETYRKNPAWRNVPRQQSWPSWTLTLGFWGQTLNQNCPPKEAQNFRWTFSRVYPVFFSYIGSSMFWLNSCLRSQLQDDYSRFFELSLATLAYNRSRLFAKSISIKKELRDLPYRKTLGWSKLRSSSNIYYRTVVKFESVYSY